MFSPLLEVIISMTNPCLFWPTPSVLATQTERNSQRHDSSGVAKKRVRFGSGREKKKLITQDDSHLHVFSLSSCSRGVDYGPLF